METERVLAVDPTRNGFGFAILEGPVVLIDRGVKGVNGDNNRKCLELLAALIARYDPDVLVVERTDDAGCLRRLRARRLIGDLLALASDCELRARRISRRNVQRWFSPTGTATKRQIAVALTRRFPELEPSLPPERKPWMSEDPRMGIFDAVAFALAFFGLVSQDRATAVFPTPTPLTHAP
jgi:hypothetical protein